MECGFFSCLKYTAIGFGLGVVGGGIVYFLLPKRRAFGPSSMPRRPALPARPYYEELQPATAGFGRRRYGRRW